MTREYELFFTEYGLATMRQLFWKRSDHRKASALGVRNGLLIFIAMVGFEMSPNLREYASQVHDARLS